jgi:hypothetical protein
MLKKSIVISTAALAFAILGVAANGCSVTANGPGPITGGDGSTSDAKKDGPATQGDTGPDITPPACYDISDAVGIQTASAPVAHQNVCNATQISGFLDACLPQGDAGADQDAAAAACDAFYAANTACATCINGPNSADAGAFIFPVIVPVSQTSVVPNTVGCVAALSTGDAACKLSFTEEQNCEESACSPCSSDADFSACISFADADTAGCPSFDPVDSTCLTAVNAVSSTDQTSCGVGATTFNAAYQAVATVVCGP